MTAAFAAPETRSVTPQGADHRRLGRWFATVVIAVAVALAYADSLDGPFVLDDVPAIVENPTLLHLRSIGRVLSPPHGAGDTVEGRPVLNLSLAINRAIGGTRVRGYHLTNLGIHLGCALLLFGIVRRTVATRIADSTAVALAAALLWALHPIQTESVTYVVQRAESLMGFFYLATLYAFIRSSGGGGGRPAWEILSAAACLLGMGTKEVMVSAPLIVLLYDRTFVAGSFRRAWSERGRIHCALAGTWVLLGCLAIGTGSRGGTIGPGSGVSPLRYGLVQARAVIHYLGLSFWPSPLVFDYGPDSVARFGDVAVQVAALVALAGLTLWAVVRRPAAGFLGAWFFALLAPTSSFLGGSRQMLAEHRMYLALAPLAAGAALVAHRFLGRWTAAALLPFAAALGVGTFLRNQDYRTAVGLYSDTVAKRPGNAWAHWNLGVALFEAGRANEAVESYRRSLRIQPDSASAEYNLATALASIEGRRDEALAMFRAAIRHNPRDARARCNYGNTLLMAGRVGDAIDQLREALRLDPFSARAHNDLALALLRIGNAGDAIAEYQRALDLSPEDPDIAYNLGGALARAGRADDAVRAYRRSLDLRPGDPATLTNLGNAFARSGDLASAIPWYEQAVRSGPSYWQARYNLGTSLAGLGRRAEARDQFLAVLRIVPDCAPARASLEALGP